MFKVNPKNKTQTPEEINHCNNIITR